MEWGDLIWALGTLGMEGPMPELLRKVPDFCPRQRMNCIQQVANLKVRACIPEIRKSLKAEEAFLIEEAALALGWLQDQPSIPELRSLLLSTDQGIRISAAQALCLMGERDGAGALLNEDTNHFFVLNRLRQPALWNRLSEIPQRETARGSIRELLERLSKSSGITMDLPPKNGPWRTGLEEGFTWPSRHGKTSALDGISSISEVDDLGFLFEADRIRILSSEDYKRFWHEWWGSESRK